MKSTINHNLRKILGFSSKVLLIAYLMLSASCNPLNELEESVPPVVLESILRSSVQPFFAELTLMLNSSEATVNEIQFEVMPKSVGHKAKSISAAYSREGARFQQKGNELVIPIFGLYQDFDNTVRLRLIFNGYAKVTEYTQKILTPRYSTIKDDSFWEPDITIKTSPKRELMFSYFLFEGGGNERPVVVDIDGELRWSIPVSGVKRKPNLFRSDGRHTFGAAWFDSKIAAFVLQRDNQWFISPISSANQPDSAQTFDIKVNDLGLSNIVHHHEVNQGKKGYLLNINAVKDGKKRFESIVLEVDNRGRVIGDWDFGDIIEKYMADKGESPLDIGKFVRHEVDWLHINSAIYSPEDDTIIASGRENFVIKVGYSDKKIRWVFGDITKHWYVNYPKSLKNAALMVQGSAEPPIGQHSLSLIDFNGEKALLLFNNGKESIEQLKTVPAGKNLSSSLVQAWKIDEANKRAELLWEYDGGILSNYCSSVYQSGTDYLVTYSLVPGYPVGTYKVVTRGIDQNKQILFEMESKGRCSPWNNKIIDLHDLRL